MITNPPGRLTEDISGATDGGFAIPLSYYYAGCSLIAGDCKSPEHKEVRTFFDGGLQIISG